LESTESTPLTYVTANGTPADGFLTRITREEGLTTRTFRQGADGSLIETSRITRDPAGRPLTSTDALGRPTTSVETYDYLGQPAPAAGEPDLRPRHRIVTTTAPDGGTRIEEYATDGTLLRLTGTGVHGQRYTSGAGTLPARSGLRPAVPGCIWRTTILLLENGTDSPEWSTAWTDPAGRPFATLTSAGNRSDSFYNTKGQLIRTVDGDGVGQLYAYDDLGRRSIAAADLNENGTIDFQGTDRSVRTARAILDDAAHGPILRTTTEAWATDNSDTPTVLSVTDQSLNGRSSWTTRSGLTATSIRGAPTGPAAWTTATTLPDNTSTVTLYAEGRPIATEQQSAAPNPTRLGRTDLAYDAHGRPARSTDARNGSTLTTYYDDDTPHTVTSPDPDGPGGPQLPQTATLTVSVTPATGLTTTRTAPDGPVTTTSYYRTGEPATVSGGRTYPISYTYDHAGRVKTLTTQVGVQASAATTTWLYEPTTGRLHQKQDAAGQGATYLYTAAGRLQQRTAARLVSGQPLTTTYDYTGTGGLLKSILYSDNTPDTTTTYNRLGQTETISDAAGLRTFLTDPDGFLRSETITGGLLGGTTLSTTPDTLRRPGAFTLTNGPSTTATTYTWHPQEGRLQKITSGSTEVTYTRHSDSALLHRTETRQTNNLRLTTERTFDFLERLTDLTHTGPPAPAAFGYAYNDANQRTTTRQPDGTTWAWDYDPLGQLQNANLSRSTDSALLPGRQYHYQYDSTGNRLTASQGDTANPAQHPQSINYQPSTLNQYTGITNPAYAEASGEAHPAATVTANGESTNRLGPYFHKRLPVTNTGTAPVSSSIVIAATENGQTESETRTAQTLPATESPQYDEDGNLKQDALWLYTWDAENRLTGMESSPAVPAGAKKKLTFTYDSQSRRIRKQVWQAQPTAPHAWILTQDRKFHYQGWNLIAEADPDYTFVKTYLWGLDLSGTFTGAGGTGGLLAINIARGPANVAGTHLVTTDGQGNVTQLLSATTGQPTAAYTYDPFGQILSATGLAANANPIRFSTRYEDPETQLLYYGYRFLDPAAGRWLNRDPLGEEGGVNLYAFVGNDAANQFDILGLAPALASLRGTVSGAEEKLRIAQSKFERVAELLCEHDSRILPAVREAVAAADDYYAARLKIDEGTLDYLRDQSLLVWDDEFNYLGNSNNLPLYLPGYPASAEYYQIIQSHQFQTNLEFDRLIGNAGMALRTTQSVANAGAIAGLALGGVGAIQAKAGGTLGRYLGQFLFSSAAGAAGGAGAYYGSKALGAGEESAQTLAVIGGLATGAFVQAFKIPTRFFGGEKSINLASAARTKHILYGDKTGGGHKLGLLRIFNGKSKFPLSWSKEKIMNAVSEIATNPASKWTQQTGAPGKMFTKAGAPVKWSIEGVYEGIKIIVIQKGNDFITAFPSY
jgi:RHS repeat-associated protein